MSSIVSAKAPNPEKGRRYLAQLDQALCNGNWSEVPELARKTDKHAPARNCFTLTARTEAQIASASHRPTSASSSENASIHSLGEAVPKLQQAVSAASSVPEDAYCASVCLAEIHWLQENSKAALEALTRDSVLSGILNTNPATLGWLEVCSPKAAFIRAVALEADGQEKGVAEVYRKAITQVPGSRTPELRRWTERLLGRACIYYYKRAQEPTVTSLTEALVAFRAWASFWQRSPPPAAGSGTSPSRIDIPRRQVWKAYYDLLSAIVHHDLLYNPSKNRGGELLVVPTRSHQNDEIVEAKSRQRAELKRVEATYESLLLNETQFPRSNQSNVEVEAWVEQAVSNWKALCGPGWTDEELGDGGKDALTHGVLDILYRAATKTFHSTAILRQLFTVHTALGEFELAMHAFNSYVEIVGKGKARAEKTGKHELGFDTDDMAVMTAAEAVRVLCKYGDREQGKKATEIGETITMWLGEQRPMNDSEIQGSDDNKAERMLPPKDPTESHLQPKTLAAAHRAVGISKAHWARLTYKTDTRAGLQAEAISSLRHSQIYDENDIETAYSLARVLAETHDVAAAIEVIKVCISCTPGSADAEDEYEGEDASLARERQLIPVWHLLALCLTTRDEYEPAVKMCEATFDQFGDSAVLFGQPVSEDSGKRTRDQRGIVDLLDSYEKESLLQIKMTQLTFVELIDGAEKAVDLGDELLALYARLFGSTEQLKAPRKPPPIALSTAPPSRAGGTLRSIVGSIRHRPERNSADDGPRQLSNGSSAPARTGGASANTNEQATGSPIAITVTNEDGISAEKGQQGHHHHLHLPFKVRGHHGDFRDAGSLRSKQSTDELNEKAALASRDRPPPVPPKDIEVTDHAQTTGNSQVVDTAVTNTLSSEAPTDPKQPLDEIKHNAPHDQWPPPPGHDDQPPEQDVRLPTAHPASDSTPAPHLGSSQDRQHRISVLLKVWLFIAGLYVRAGLHEDANGAVDEAYRLVEAFEADKGAEHANAMLLYQKGWGGGKSVDELWGDMWSARGEIASARSLPFEAMTDYEQALSYCPDHPEGIIGIANLLMDIYEEKMPAEKPKPLLNPLPTGSGVLTPDPAPASVAGSRPTTAKSSLAGPGRLAQSDGHVQEPTPADLNRLAARDRAYMLLSNLTKLGSGWDNPEAWLTLARAHELSKQIDKAKQALWWVVELEDSRPMRPWNEVTPGGYAL